MLIFVPMYMPIISGENDVVVNERWNMLRMQIGFSCHWILLGILLFLQQRLFERVLLG